MAVIHKFLSAEGDQQVIVELARHRTLRATYPADATAAELRRFVDVLSEVLVPTSVPPDPGTGGAAGEGQ